VTKGQAPDWDPRDHLVLEDQRAAYDGMRERCPVAHSEFLGWSLFRHADVVRVVSDPGTFSSATKRLPIPNGMDPPEHAAYRGSLEPYFSLDRMAHFEPCSRQIASDLLDGAITRGEIEAIEDFVNPHAHQALCAFVGWPVEDWNRVSGWTHGNQEAAFRQDPEAGAALAREFATYVTEFLNVRRADGSSDDLMGELIHTTVHDEPLTNEQIVSALRTWTAGHGTVAAALGIVIRYLAEHADLQDRLRVEPELLDRAVGEILRTDGPLVANNRTATRDAEIGGRAIGTGDRISLMWIAANRDPAVFADAGRVHLDRDPVDNLLFGAGIHRCLGEPLARLNLRVGVDVLLRRTRRFEFAGSETPTRHVYPSNGLGSLLLRLTPTSGSER
jgi:cytochrome P450